MSISFLQNVNMSRPSLDLLIHHARETETGILLVSESNHVSATPNWFSSQDNKAAIFVDPYHAKLPCETARIGPRFIAVYYGSYLIISIYAPPSLNLRDFNNLLDELSEVLSHRVSKIIIEGDFNAKAKLWGSNTTNRRGFLLSRWAAERDLRIANTEKPTCIRPQGSSIIDLTWISPDLIQHIRNWRVEEEVESLSDHVYISFGIQVGSGYVLSKN